MFFYFYDSFVSDKNNETELRATENRLIELGINGRIEKLSVIRNAKEIIGEGIKNGAHTIVAVGNDHTLAKVINIVADKNIIVGYLPFDANSKFAKILGLGSALTACDVLSKRLVMKINLGKANQNFFLTSASIPSLNDAQIEIDEKYEIGLRQTNCQLHILNLGNFLNEKNIVKWRLLPQKNNNLSLVISPQNTKQFGGLIIKKNKEPESVFPAKKIKITSAGKSLPVILDEQTTIKTPITITVRPKKIALIVGKERMI